MANWTIFKNCTIITKESAQEVNVSFRCAAALQEDSHLWSDWHSWQFMRRPSDQIAKDVHTYPVPTNDPPSRNYQPFPTVCAEVCCPQFPTPKVPCWVGSRLRDATSGGEQCCIHQGRSPWLTEKAKVPQLWREARHGGPTSLENGRQAFLKHCVKGDLKKPQK